MKTILKNRVDKPYYSETILWEKKIINFPKEIKGIEKEELKLLEEMNALAFTSVEYAYECYVTLPLEVEIEATDEAIIIKYKWVLPKVKQYGNAEFASLLDLKVTYTYKAKVIFPRQLMETALAVKGKLIFPKIFGRNTIKVLQNGVAGLRIGGFSEEVGDYFHYSTIEGEAVMLGEWCRYAITLNGEIKKVFSANTCSERFGEKKNRNPNKTPKEVEEFNTKYPDTQIEYHYGILWDETIFAFSKEKAERELQRLRELLKKRLEEEGLI